MDKCQGPKGDGQKPPWSRADQQVPARPARLWDRALSTSEPWREARTSPASAAGFPEHRRVEGGVGG